MSRLFRPTARQSILLVGIGAIALGYALFLRFGVIQPEEMARACDAGLHALLCPMRAVVVALIRYPIFGWAALSLALVNFIRPNVTLLAAGLIACAFGLVLYNLNLSSIAAALLILSLARPVTEA